MFNNQRVLADMQMHSAPRHISITGDLGSGKSVVAAEVARTLGVEVISTGTVQREIARDLNLSTLETNFLAERDRNIDQRVDSVTREFGRTSLVPIVFDSRMAWKMVPNSLRVRLIVDPGAAVSRVYDRTANAERYETVAEARRDLRLRYESEVRRFVARYGVDVTSLKHYDLVIDTSDADVSTVAAAIVEAYASESNDSRVLASPIRLLPSDLALNNAGMRRSDQVSNEIPVVYSRPFMAFVSDLERIEYAISSAKTLIPVHVVAEGSEEIRAGISADQFVSGLLSGVVLDKWEIAHNRRFTSFREWSSGE